MPPPSSVRISVLAHGVDVTFNPGLGTIEAGERAVVVATSLTGEALGIDMVTRFAVGTRRGIGRGRKVDDLRGGPGDSWCCC